MRSPILRALAMSWVIETAVLPRSLTHLTIRSLITSAMIGSRPVVGSSKKMISGCGGDGAGQRHALLHAAGQLRRVAARRPRRRARPGPGLGGARRAPSRGAALRCASRPKATFSQTGRLSNSAPPWNSMPILARDRLALAAAAGRARPAPSISMLPASGSQQAEDAFQQHRLAGARAADHHHRGARRRRRGRCRRAPPWRRTPCARRGCGSSAAAAAHRAKNSSVRT